MTIETQECISQMFSIFHDGGISEFRSDAKTLTLTVEISYLAQRVNPAFRRFEVSLVGVANLRFIPWLDDPAEKPVPRHDLSTIFSPDLEILSGELENGEIRVVCNQPQPGLGYCGGDLYFSAASAQVKDEAGVQYSIEELSALSRGYWDDWARANRA